MAKFATVVNSSVGFGTYISFYSKLFNCKIGRYCSIGQKIQIVFGEHPTSTFVSTHPTFYSVASVSGFSYVKENLFEEYVYIDTEKIYFVEIANDVWIGCGALLMPGIRMGDGTIIAAGRVTKDVPPYAIVGGIPAKTIRYRFESDEIDFLMNLKWWDKELSWIKENIELFVIYHY